MKVHVKGTGQTLDLTTRDYVGQGGEGVIYARNGVAYKVYHDPKRMIPLGKIQELGKIQDPGVIKPEQVLLDKQDQPIGYTTKYIQDAWTLCQLFPQAFRTREGVTPEIMQGLVRKLQEHITSIHKALILAVDLNEMNFLVGRSFDQIYCIDVDGYHTSKYPTQAIMDSIRDWSVTNHQWTELSDWYSFGILSFQMFIGLHPFKGRYKGAKAEFKGRLPSDDEADAFAATRRRMQHNISVLHPEVGSPAAALPLTLIPKSYMAWYEALFVQGKRLPPPTDFGAPVMVLPIIKTVQGTATLEIVEIGSFDGDITHVYGDSQIVVVTTKGIWADGLRVGGGILPPEKEPKNWSALGITPRNDRPILVGFIQGQKIPVMVDVANRKQINFGLSIEEVASANGRVFLRTPERILELILTDTSTQVIASTKEVVQTLPLATRLFPGTAIQKMLGATFVSLFTPKGALQVHIKELDAYNVIVDAKFDGTVLMVLAVKNGQYDRLVFRFQDGTYDVRVVPGVPNEGLNSVTLDSGVCVCLNEEEKLEIFSGLPGSSKIKYVEDPTLSGDMRLFRQGGTVLFARGSKLYRMRMR